MKITDDRGEIEEVGEQEAAVLIAMAGWRRCVEEHAPQADELAEPEKPRKRAGRPRKVRVGRPRKVVNDE